MKIPLAVTALLLSTWTLASETAVPRHLALARELVANIRPENNQYVLGGRFVRFPGDPGSHKYALQADCSGFLLALFERAEYPTHSRMGFLTYTRTRQRPAAEDFVYSIENGRGFRRVGTVADIRPGDLLAHAMLDPEDKKQARTTGHVYLLDSAPRAIEPRRPRVEGTRQFEVVVIDSNEEHLGQDDTRLADRAKPVKGLGKGTIRLYADADGEIVGWARTFKNANRFFSYSPRFPSDTKLRKAVIGRIEP